VEKWPEGVLDGAIFFHSRKRFSKFPHKIFVIILRGIIGLQNFLFFFSANHNPEL